MLQDLLLKWVPDFKDNLKVNGIYERKTQVALEYFKKLYGFGKDGSVMDAKTSQALVDLKLDNFKDYELINDNAKIIYDLMKKTGFPYNSRNIVLEDEQIKAVADFDPHRLISCQTYGMEIQDKINKYRWVPGEVYEMQALTAKRFFQMHKDFEENFPDYHLTITSTTEGSHIDPNHRDGKAIDFIYVNAKGHPVEDIKYKDGKEISLYNENLYIKYLELIIYRNGFIPLNEYIYNSPHKTGPHMHIDFNDEIKKKKN
ncbi:MAG: hypothetical protein HYU63_03840 [Armatimonadetes bacterium]|nr:hypothetical protein [Armatimonadota bacterium]